MLISLSLNVEESVLTNNNEHKDSISIFLLMKTNRIDKELIGRLKMNLAIRVASGASDITACDKDFIENNSAIFLSFNFIKKCFR